MNVEIRPHRAGCTRTGSQHTVVWTTTWQVRICRTRPRKAPTDERAAFAMPISSKKAAATCTAGGQTQRVGKAGKSGRRWWCVAMTLHTALTG